MTEILAGKNKQKLVEYGDFQTPKDLAKDCVRLIFQKFSNIKNVIEPTCGLGNILVEALNFSSQIQTAIGFDINNDYVEILKYRLEHITSTNIKIEQKNFFSIDWLKIGLDINNQTLFIGNPPWVTNSVLAKIDSVNLPQKLNFQNYSGMDALTGKSNFDISEWMMIKLVELISVQRASMAFLLKTSVARKVFMHIAKRGLNVADIAIYNIDAHKNFSVNVDACLFLAKGVDIKPNLYSCSVYDSLETISPKQIIGYINGKIIADISLYETVKEIDTGSEFDWRSGVKHDCTKVLELIRDNGKLLNGYKEIVDIPDDYLYPLYKSSDIAKKNIESPRKFILITQSKIGQATKPISQLSPRTWKYLKSHENEFLKRKSSIYNDTEPFSIFGIGEYSFMPWKVTISGLYKKPVFNLVGKYLNKPIILDDTCYFLGFNCFEQAEFVYLLLSSNIANEFISSIVFLDSKRPVTATLLNRINLRKIAVRLNLESKFDLLFHHNTYHQLQIDLWKTGS